MKILKITLLLIAFTLMAIIIYFIDSVPVIDVISGSFFIVVNGFLGVDLAAMIKNSNHKPAGDFQDMKMYRYIIVFLMMLFLFSLSIYRKEIDGVQFIM